MPGGLKYNLQTKSGTLGRAGDPPWWFFRVNFFIRFLDVSPPNKNSQTNGFSPKTPTFFFTKEFESVEGEVQLPQPRTKKYILTTLGHWCAFTDLYHTIPYHTFKKKVFTTCTCTRTCTCTFSEKPIRSRRHSLCFVAIARKYYEVRWTRSRLASKSFPAGKHMEK